MYNHKPVSSLQDARAFCEPPEVTAMRKAMLLRLKPSRDYTAEPEILLGDRTVEFDIDFIPNFLHKKMFAYILRDAGWTVWDATNHVSINVCSYKLWLYPDAK